MTSDMTSDMARLQERIRARVRRGASTGHSLQWWWLWERQAELHAMTTSAWSELAVEARVIGIQAGPDELAAAWQRVCEEGPAERERLDAAAAKRRHRKAWKVDGKLPRNPVAHARREARLELDRQRRQALRERKATGIDLEARELVAVLRADDRASQPWFHRPQQSVPMPEPPKPAPEMYPPLPSPLDVAMQRLRELLEQSKARLEVCQQPTQPEPEWSEGVEWDDPDDDDVELFDAGGGRMVTLAQIRAETRAEVEARQAVLPPVPGAEGYWRGVGSA